MRLCTLALALLVVTAGGGATTATAAQDHLVPSWMTVDADAKMVTMDVIAGFNPNNSNWNYNGYHDGDLTVVLPLDWSVHINFTNHDADVPHSMVVMADPGKGDLPLQAGRDQAAFARAYTKSPEQGLSAGDHDLIAFKAKKVGKYLMFCGVPGHGQSGMWVHVEVTPDAASPYLKVAKGAEPGRP